MNGFRFKDASYGPDGLPLEKERKLSGPIRSPFPGDRIRTADGEATVCSYWGHGTPEVSSFDIRYDDGRVTVQVNDARLYTVIDNQNDNTIWPLKYLHRGADLLFTWEGGSRVDVLRGGSYTWWYDSETFSVADLGPDKVWRVDIGADYPSFVAACDAMRCWPGPGAGPPRRRP